ncbi:sulfite exporter TauE/SafE family protein [Planktotalea arctica]|uniref:sulfite exporter TauE/SafE family protein n=1 Tax=Planktotalea arctica TaxID=1481893 RepID=UPI00321B9929
MLWDFSFFAIAVPAVIFAGISKGGFGSGAAFASASILALVMTPGQALALMLPLLMLIDVATLRPFWGKWHWPSARLLILGGTPGVLIGALLYRAVNDDVIRFLIGAMSVLFVLWQIVQRRGWISLSTRALSDKVGFFAGTAAGFTSFVSHAGGPPSAIYLLSLGLSKTQYQANTVLVFWIVNLLKAAAYAFLGIFTLDLLELNLVLAPFALLGAWIGVKAHCMVPERVFFAITYVLLSVTGTKLIYDALS